MLRLQNSLAFAVIVWLTLTLVSVGQEGSSRRSLAPRQQEKLLEGRSEANASQPGIGRPISGRPNIILINLDDADVDIFSDEMLNRYLPNIKELSTHGLSFTNCHVTTPLCGPSRVCLMLGQHAHRHGVKTNLPTGKMNNGFTGGYDLFKAKGYEKEHLGVWMQRAGYRTMMIGKYMHGKMNPVGIPGWDDLFICFGGNYYKTSRYASRLPMEKRRRATGEDEYRTVVEASEAVGMIEKQAERNSQKPQPFFLYIAPLAPHLPARQSPMLQQKYKELGKEIRIPKTPDFNEEDVSDKPQHLRAPKLTEKQVKGLHEEYRRRVVSTKSVDDMVANLFDVLDRTGLRENTYIFFTSDHGYQLGHNRMIAKKLPYHRDTVIPLFVVGPGVAQGTSDHLLAHIDFTATFLDIAGGKSPLGLDGKSFLPLLEDPNSIKFDDYRKSLLIQGWEEKGHLGSFFHSRYASLRTRSEIFIQWSNGAKEYYDLAKDPYQIENGIGELEPAKQSAFEEELRVLKTGMAKPIVTISNPDLISRRPGLTGVVEDDEAVEQVVLQIQDADKKLYWNGNAWTEEAVFFQSELSNHGGLISDWNYQADLSAIAHDGQVMISHKASSKDKNGQLTWSDTNKRIFQVDAIEPITSLIVPVQNSELGSPVTIRGECSDNHMMSGVELTLQRLDDDMYWDGAQWVSSKATFFKRVAKNVWHVRVAVPPGRYKTTARALDQAGNYDSSPGESEFSIK